MTPQTATATTAPRNAGLPRTTDRRGHPRAVQHHSDADVYAGIARAWWLMHRAGEHHQRPMRSFLVRPGFAEEVWGRIDLDPHDVLAVCARLIALEDFRVREIATITEKGEGLTEALDPLGGLWMPLTNTPELGVHFWQLVIVPIELRCIGRADAPPSLRYGRFARARLRAVPGRR